MSNFDFYFFSGGRHLFRFSYLVNRWFGLWKLFKKILNSCSYYKIPRIPNSYAVASSLCFWPFLNHLSQNLKQVDPVNIAMFSSPQITTVAHVLYHSYRFYWMMSSAAHHADHFMCLSPEYCLPTDQGTMFSFVTLLKIGGVSMFFHLSAPCLFKTNPMCCVITIFWIRITSQTNTCYVIMVIALKCF